MLKHLRVRIIRWMAGDMPIMLLNMSIAKPIELALPPGKEVIIAGNRILGEAGEIVVASPRQ